MYIKPKNIMIIINCFNYEKFFNVKSKFIVYFFVFKKDVLITILFVFLGQSIIIPFVHNNTLNILYLLPY